MIGETNASTSAGGSSVYYGTCSTSASTAAKTVTVGEKFKLTEGAMIVVTFTNANTASTPTLNVTPSGGSATGAKSIRINASSALNTASNPETDYYTVRGTCEFIYDGTYWILVTGRKASRSLRLDDSSGTSLGVYYPTGQHNTQVITLPMGSRELTDVQAVFTLQATPDYIEFPYCAEITDSGVTPNTYVSVTYSNEQSQSLMYSPTAVSDTGKIKLYARQAVGTQTIPTIGIGMDYVDLDSSQPISSPIEARTLTLVSSSDAEYLGFPYKYSFPCVGATATRTADVTFDVGDAQSGNFAPVCETGAGVIYIWAKASQSTARIGYMLYYTENATVVSGTVGDDTHPVKIVNGQAVAVTDALATELYATSPNVLVDNVSDWLHVSLTAKDSPYNRTTILTNAVSTNRPQQSGDSIYCYFGTRYVFWQATNFVTVFVVGQGNDSGSHIWLNNYNANAGGWVGWKRTDFDQGYSPAPIEVFSTTLGVTVQVRGAISYHRIGPKKGLLSGTLYISSNSATNVFNNLSLNNFGNALGVSFKNPSSNRTTGRWVCLESGKTVWFDGMGYGTALNIITDGTVQLGRYYQDNGAYGAYPMSTFGNTKIVFEDVYLEEN